MLQPSLNIPGQGAASAPLERIIIAGHSHTFSLGGLQESPDLQPTLLPIEHESGMVLGFSGAWPRDEAYWTAITEFEGDNLVLLSWQGNQHVAAFLLERGPSFDFLLSSHPDFDVDRGKLIVPEALIRNYFIESIAPLDDILKKLTAFGQNKLVVLGTPPPKGDNEKLATRLNTEGHFKLWTQYYNIDLSEVRLTPPNLRLKLWCVIQDLLEETARKNFVDFVPIPDSVKDEAGFLREEYWNHDVTHANRLFGSVILEDVFRLYGNQLKKR